MIRISKLSNKLTNKNKKEKLNEFIKLYAKVVEDFIDIMWNNLNDKYECPKFVSTKNYVNSKLSQRAIKCAATQACGMVKANTEKARKYVYVINKLEQENKDTSKIKENFKKLKIVKPTINDNFKCELNSICCDLRKTNKFWYLQLKSIGKKFGKIKIVIQPHRQTLYWLNKSKMLNSFLVSNNFVDVRFEIKNEYKKEGKIIGIDQGISNCISCSDGQISKKNKDGYDLSKIMKILCIKKKGSKGFKRTQEHRKNYINWSINQLNLDNIKQINIEKIKNLRKGKQVDRFRSHWSYTLILDKLKRFCEEQKVFVKEQSCVYRSQRCNVCGLVRKNQRKGKIYSCLNCGYIGDSDINASLNHEIELPEIDYLRHLGYNEVGFYWRSDGIYDLNGNEFTVCCTKKI